MAKTRVAFVGSGGMAEAHSKALATIGDVEVVGYADVNLSLAKAKAGQYGGRAYRDPVAMLDHVRPDALFVCLPPFAHGIELAAIERRIPFFVEKPIGLDLRLTRRIARALAGRRLITCAGYMNRYRRGVQTVRKLLGSDPPILVTGGWIGQTPRARQGAGIWSWWVRKSRSGGQFLEQVTHTVDLARFLCGQAVSVHAFAAKGLNQKTPPGYSIEDASVVNIRFAGGAVANLWACCAANGGGGGVSLNVYANRTTAHFSGWEHSVRIQRAGRDTVEIAEAREIFPVEDEVFLRAVRTRKPAGILSDYLDGARTLAVTLAANESMKTNRPVAVPRI
jgi:myo-inositol 2-dehydrogenase/D-chiro-inositol 1-dehydrogenase